jgi:hypothetical protein
MPWCPKCRIEYREGFTKCGDCGADLVEELAPLPPKVEPETRFDTEVFLVTVDDAAQASIIESLLHSFNIPTARNYKEAGSYVRVFTGTSSFGIDICVPSHNLDEAKEIVNASVMERPEINVEPVSTSSKRQTHWERRRGAKWIMLAALALMLAVSILFAIMR